MASRAGAVALLVLMGLLAAPPSPVRAQETPADTRIEEARRLRESGDLDRAVRILRSYLREHPEDPVALRLLATSLERAGEVGAAREAFEAALRHYPDDPLLRLDYGRLLVEMGATEEARELLLPMLADPAIPVAERAEAHVLLGRLALASGARRAGEAAFRRALELDPDHTEALRRLRASYQERSPWVRTRIGNGDDDQPLRTFHSVVSGGYRLLPWLEADAQGGVRSFDGEASDETVPEVALGATAVFDLVNLEARAWGGGYRRSLDDEMEWTGGGHLAFLAPGGVRIRAEGARRPYLFTIASLDTVLVPVSFGGSVGRPEARGLAGEMAYEQLRFEDDNRVEEFRAWILAPAYRSRDVTLRLGYEFRGADAREITFVPEEGPPFPTEGGIPGRYAPIYTPEQLQSHSLRGELRTERPGSFTGTLEGGWGFFAEEEAPMLFASPGGVVDLQFERRSFEPWNITGRIRAPLAPALQLQVEAGHRRTAFRAYSFFRVTGTFYHLPADLD